MTILEWKFKKIREISKFAEWWKEKSVNNPDDFPKDLNEEWEEQFYFHRMNNNE